MTYRLVKVGKGWQCRAYGTRIVGWGSRPDLAITDYHRQLRRTKNSLHQ